MTGNGWAGEITPRPARSGSAFRNLAGKSRWHRPPSPLGRPPEAGAARRLPSMLHCMTALCLVDRRRWQARTCRDRDAATPPACPAEAGRRATAKPPAAALKRWLPAPARAQRRSSRAGAEDDVNQRRRGAAGSRPAADRCGGTRRQSPGCKLRGAPRIGSRPRRLAAGATPPRASRPITAAARIVTGRRCLRRRAGVAGSWTQPLQAAPRPPLARTQA